MTRTGSRRLASSAGALSAVRDQSRVSAVDAEMRAIGATSTCAVAAPTTTRPSVTLPSASTCNTPSPAGRCNSGALTTTVPLGAASTTVAGAWRAMSLVVLRGSVDGLNAVRAPVIVRSPATLSADSEARLSRPTITSPRAWPVTCTTPDSRAGLTRLPSVSWSCATSVHCVSR